MTGFKTHASIVAAVAIAGLVSACSSETTVIANDSETVVAPTNDMAMAMANGTAATPGTYSAAAMLKTADGTDAGRAVARETPQGIEITVDVTGLPAGAHGAHVHMTGRCDAPDFTSAGGHWNPANKQHGLENPQGAHAGDMPNLTVADGGTGTLTFTLPGGTYAGLLDDDGAAMMIHAGPDDMKTDPSGDSGARIACGVFEGV